MGKGNRSNLLSKLFFGVCMLPGMLLLSAYFLDRRDNLPIIGRLVVWADLRMLNSEIPYIIQFFLCPSFWTIFTLWFLNVFVLWCFFYKQKENIKGKIIIKRVASVWIISMIISKYIYNESEFIRMFFSKKSIEKPIFYYFLSYDASALGNFIVVIVCFLLIYSMFFMALHKLYEPRQFYNLNSESQVLPIEMEGEIK